MKAALPGGEQQVRQANAPQRMDSSKMKIGRGQGIDEGRRQKAEGRSEQPGADTAVEEKQQPVRVEKQIGRNDQCPCGSGKKYKNCHGK